MLTVVNMKANGDRDLVTVAELLVSQMDLLMKVAGVKVDIMVRVYTKIKRVQSTREIGNKASTMV